jgi:hypothetical protein
MIADMMRVLAGATAWATGTALAVGLAWFGAGMVVRNTADSPSVPPVIATPASPTASVPSPSVPVPTPTPTRSRATGSALPSAAAGALRSYQMAGGRVTLRETPASAVLVSAVPDSGFTVQNWSGAGWLRVDFSSGTRVSSLIASWNGHAPSITVTN